MYNGSQGLCRMPQTPIISVLASTRGDPGRSELSCKPLYEGPLTPASYDLSPN